MSTATLQHQRDPLTAYDRCDRCGAQAYVAVRLESGGELLFCSHHANAHAAHIKRTAAAVHDETHKLDPTPVVQDDDGVV